MNPVKINDTLDYKELGLACGLELHQQLDTHKLFCNCSSTIVKDGTKPSKIIRRKLRAVQSESGEVDLAALYEQQKDFTYVYEFYNSCNCLVESDSQPPFPINKEALEISVMVSKLTNCTLVDKSFVMRKQVIDGSNVGGFQRTTMISTDGYLDFDFGRVRVDKILLEEDSARPIERNEKEARFSLDRLGVPLIELVAWHDIHTPEDVQKVAKALGGVFRITCRVKRGLGTIRQDINISIKDGARIELKGTQDLQLIPEIVKREVIRQLNLIEIKKELKIRQIISFNIVSKNISDIFKNSESKIITSAFKNNKDVFIFKLENMKGILGFEIQPNRRIGSEISSYLKKRTTLKGLFHSDELPNYGITNKDVLNINKNLDIKDNDSFIITVCNKDEIRIVKDVIEDRLNKLLIGVICETRIVNVEGNSEFQRPLSSGARMYPETDLKPITFDADLLESVRNNMPKSVEERRILYSTKYKINNQLIDNLVLNNYAMIFEKIVDNLNIPATRVAIFLLEDLTKLSRDHRIEENSLDKNKIYEFFEYKDFNKIPNTKLLDIFVEFTDTNKTMSQIVSEKGIFKELDSLDFNKIMSDIIEENKDKIISLKERSKGLLMGRFMSKTKGLVDGRESSKIVNGALEDFLNKN
jgi:glutamyl-tRNA(Gln) amidotransferase subunit E